MDTTQALAYLGLNDNASQAEVTSTINKKQQQLSNQQDKAPTDALKQKYQASLAQLAEAKVLLVTDIHQPQTSQASPLSQTKLADLPGATPALDLGDNEAALALQAGNILADRYEIREQIGAGGMGAVYQAFDRNTQKEIALKVMLPSLLKNAHASERFMDEARISQQLSHPNIVNVFDVQRDNDLCFLTMELLQGQDLRQVMKNQRLARQPFAVEDVQELMLALSDGLDYAHKYTVHRDIKPENIWLCEDGSHKIMDFGIARVQSSSQHTQTGAAMGTAYYMAPEQLKGMSDIDGRADQYALAVMAYEMLTGEVPAGMIEPVQDHRKDVPKAVADAIHRGLSPRPQNRFESVKDFAQALQQTGRGFSLPALDLQKLKMPAAIIVGILLLGGLVSSGALNLSNLLPMSQEEIAENKAAAAKLEGEIQVLKRRLNSADRELQRLISEAKRDRHYTEESRLLAWQKLVQQHTIDGARAGEYAGFEAQSKVFAQDKDFASALNVLTMARDGYADLKVDFKAAENLSAELPQTLNQLESLRQYSFSEQWLLKDQIEEAYREADRFLSEGFIGRANEAYRSIDTAMRPLLRQVDEISRFDISIAKSLRVIAALSKKLDVGELAAVIEQQGLLQQSNEIAASMVDQKLLSTVLDTYRGIDASMKGTVTELQQADKSLSLASSKRKAYLAYSKQQGIGDQGKWAQFVSAQSQLIKSEESLKQGDADTANKQAAKAAAAYEKINRKLHLIISAKAEVPAAEQACLDLAKTLDKSLCDAVIAERKNADAMLAAGKVGEAGKSFSGLFQRYIGAMYEAIKLQGVTATESFEFYLPLKTEARMEMVFIPGGKLQLGVEAAVIESWKRKNRYLRDNQSPSTEFSYQAFVMGKYLLGCKELRVYFPENLSELDGGCKPEFLPSVPPSNAYVNYPISYPVDEIKLVSEISSSLGLSLRRPTNVELEYVLAGKDGKVLRKVDSYYGNVFRSFCDSVWRGAVSRARVAAIRSKAGAVDQLKRLAKKDSENDRPCSFGRGGSGYSLSQMIRETVRDESWDEMINDLSYSLHDYTAIGDVNAGAGDRNWGVVQAFYDTRTQDCYRKGQPYGVDAHTPVAGGEKCDRTIRGGYRHGREGYSQGFYHVSTGYMNGKGRDNSAIRLVLPL
mgnify:CR=1 FL=1